VSTFAGLTAAAPLTRTRRANAAGRAVHRGGTRWRERAAHGGPRAQCLAAPGAAGTESATSGGVSSPRTSVGQFPRSSPPARAGVGAVVRGKFQELPAWAASPASPRPRRAPRTSRARARFPPFAAGGRGVAGAESVDVRRRFYARRASVGQVPRSACAELIVVVVRDTFQEPRP
jgi:hypothetical protein